MFGGGFGGQTACGTQFIRPNRNGRQRRGSIFGSGDGLGDGGAKCFPNHQQLGFRAIQLRGEFTVHAVPIAIGGELHGLGLPLFDINAQGIEGGLRVFPRFRRKHFDALCQQHGGFALHLDAALQIFNHAHTLNELGFQTRQGFAAQRRTGFGGIALPREGIGDVEFAHIEQGLCFRSPFGGDGFLCLLATRFINTLAHGFGSAFVLFIEFLVHLGKLFRAGVALEPFAHTRSTLTRSRSRKSAPGQAVKLGNIVVFGGGRRSHNAL